jgi:hypothetical protein
MWKERVSCTTLSDQLGRFQRGFCGGTLSSRGDSVRRGAVRNGDGAVAFAGKSDATIYGAILNREPEPPTALNRSIPPKLSEVIPKALEKNRDLRYQHASEIRTDLLRLKRDTESRQHISAATAVEAGSSGKWWRTRRSLIYSTAVTLLVLVLGVGYRSWKGREGTTRGALREIQLTRNSSENPAEPFVTGSSDLDADFAKLSADNAWVLYCTVRRGDIFPQVTADLMRVPSTGGTPEMVLKIPSDAMSTFDCPLNQSASCVFSRSEQGEMAFYALDPVHGLGKELARTKLGSADDLNLSLSPDGSRIGISSQDQLPQQIRIVDLAAHTEHNLSLTQGERIHGLAWTADGRAFFASVAQANGFELIRIDQEGKTHLLLQPGRHEVLDPIPSPDGRYLAFSQRTLENHVWMVENF